MVLLHHRRMGIEIFGASHKVTVSNPLNLKSIVIFIVIIWCHFVSLKITNIAVTNIFNICGLIIRQS